MSEPVPGQALLTLLAGAQSEVVIFSPFIKVDALRQALAAVPAGSELRVVTRWRPEEVHAGVSDLEVYDELAERPETTLLLCDRLHAKFYRADGAVLVGSANLTGLGMGWRAGANIELLLPFPFDEPLAEFERMVLTRSVAATADIREAMEAAVAALPPRPPVAALDRAEATTGAQHVVPWLPQSRYPSNIWLHYSGQEERLTSAARNDAAADLVGMQVPPGLAEESLRRYVAAILAQHTVVGDLGAFTREGQRFGTIRAALRCNAQVTATARDPGEVLQTLMRWLTYYLPEVYEVRVVRFSEVLRRR